MSSIDPNDRSGAIDQRCPLAAFPLFQPLGHNSYDQLASCVRRWHISPGGIIYSTGSRVIGLFGIRAGTVKILLQSQGGKEIVLRHVAAGEIFGETELFTGRERSAEAIAMTECDLVELKRRDLMPVLERDPRFCLRVLEFISERLQAATDYIAEVSLLDLRARLARTVLRQVKWPGGSPLPRIAIPQRELAEIAGSSREYINRILKEWERASIVRLDGGSIHLLSCDELARIADLL
jgi:CRP/FNR family transcriptional regulator, cyclic AMP receptor protein